MRSCKEVTCMISDSLDRQLPRRQRIALKMHMFMCKFCSRARQQMLFITKAIHHHLLEIENFESASDIFLSQEASERIKRHLIENCKKEDH